MRFIVMFVTAVCVLLTEVLEISASNSHKPRGHEIRMWRSILRLITVRKMSPLQMACVGLHFS